jgi:type III pantothenate kinase
MIDGLIEKIIAEMQGSETGKSPKIIGTGGMAKTIMPYCQHDIIVDDHLIFKGLNIACSTSLGVEMTA